MLGVFFQGGAKFNHLLIFQNKLSLSAKDEIRRGVPRIQCSTTPSLEVFYKKFPTKKYK